MSKVDATAPATKADIQALSLQLQRFMEQSEKRWEQNEKRWEQNDKRWEQNDKRWEQNDKRWEANEKRWKIWEKDRNKRDKAFDQKLDDLRLHFDIAVENMYHDFRGAFDDRTAEYKNEVLELKKRTSAIERRLQFSRR